MMRAVKRWSKRGATAMMVLAVACSTGDQPAGPTALSRQPNTTADWTSRMVTITGMSTAAGVLPDWIANPETLPNGRVGKNNCTFEFGQPVPQWDFHPDAGCWEHAGPDGWIRNQQEKIHIPNFRPCNGGPGDANVIRVCLADKFGQPIPGQLNPCSLDEVTGPFGCARCVVNPTCH